ncbi:hypothetical protein BM477_05745 [Boudabousia marimammalium]|uniref:Uncharacterized protein n=1 Tax=Boudabousia marimammalium TaxID=156892 RepID=A0A1Q5PMD7_9ACTO|nr:hypothetical protein BM477_05745 [Boudabousia marimammalium]
MTPFCLNVEIWIHETGKSRSPQRRDVLGLYLPAVTKLGPIEETRLAGTDDSSKAPRGLRTGEKSRNHH